MKTKKLKFVIALAVIVLAIMILNTKSVKANTQGYIEKGTITNEIFNEVVPNEVTLDMKEAKMEKLEDNLFNEISKKLSNKGITVVKNDEYISGKPSLDLLFQQVDETLLYADTIFVSFNDANSNNYFSKEIKVNWTNIVNENQEDKEDVEKLLEKLGFKKDNKTGNYILNKKEYKDVDNKEILEEIDELLNNPEISLMNYDADGGAASCFETNSSRAYKVFKNNVYYENIEYYCDTQYQVTVPENIGDSEKEYIDYAIPKIRDFLKINGINVNELTVDKISGYWYKVNGDNEEFLGNIIIRKQEGTYVDNNLYINNLPMNINIVAEAKENLDMQTELKNKGYTNVLATYTLKLDENKTLDNTIDITFKVGTQYNGKTACVLQQKKDGTYTSFEKEVKDGKITISTSEVSNIAIGLKEDIEEEVNQENNQENNQNTNVSEEVTDKGELDETPKTGNDNISLISILSMLSLTSLAGIITLKKF